MTALVRSLDHESATVRELVGGKASVLARLRDRGFSVPEGVVVTTEAYRETLDTPEMEETLAALRDAVARDDDAERRRLASDLRAAIRERGLPAGVAEALREARPGGSVAVRSSATAEDLPDASFAGQYDSFLDAGDDDLPERVVDCMASAFGDRAVAYRAAAGLDADEVAVAVLVQRFVEPDVSGIAFSADPVSGRRSVTVVDAGPGRGTAQVSGTATADTVRFDRSEDRILEYRTGGDRDSRVLSPGDVRSLSAIVARIADELGPPQDVEWAIVDGEISILQARPITALFPVPEPRPTDGRVHVYYSFGHRQGCRRRCPRSSSTRGRGSSTGSAVPWGCPTRTRRPPAGTCSST
ncbi:PEP/pyruvate-binding domain-containing protein [Halobaculum litoreum]|uniref:PEP/pyruvate-binding domain-containing protein n=1 Tax=Halobaculum litoreum TaxID=3031998 RepID=A0ABD5XSX2_9EURY